MKKKLIIILIITLTIVGVVTLKTKQKIGEENSNNNYICEEREGNNVETNSEEKSQKDEIKNNIIGSLEIKKINLNGPIKEGSNSKVLKEYIGHIEETPIYNGNVCLAAHNRGNKYSYFSRINELVEGDEIIYNTDIYSKHYKVNNISEIDETDWKMLEDCSENKITLITCIKNKRNKRLCVQAVEI